MSVIQDELNELVQNADSIASATADIANAITAKGGTVSSGDGLLDFANDIANIPSFTPTEEQLTAMNSGIDSTKVQQISTNENNISSIAGKTTGMDAGGANYISCNGIKMYFDTTAPSGASDGDLWVGG